MKSATQISVTSVILSINNYLEKALQYLELLKKTGIEVGSVSNGPERNETMFVPGSKLERLLP